MSCMKSPQSAKVHFWYIDSFNPINIIEEDLILLKEFCELLKDAGAPSKSEFNGFLACAEASYGLYLDLLKGNRSELILPPW
jgi:hypothetical protein